MLSENKSQIRIGFDARCMSIPGGAANYTKHLIKTIALKSPENFKFVVFYNDKKLLGTFTHPNIQEIAFNFNHKLLFIFWDQIIIPILIFKHKVNIIHGLKNSTPIITSAKRIVTVLDLIPVLYPFSMSRIESLYWEIVLRLDSILKVSLIFISKSTEDDFLTFFKTKNSLTVTHLGAHQIPHPQNQNETKDILLYNGAQEPRKNLPTLIKAFYKFQLKYPDTKLYLVGKPGREDKMIPTTIKELKLDDKVIRTGFVTDEELGNIYAHTFAYAYVSIYEGFGLPILEAMSRGVPVITSNISSMPEVAGDAAILVDPNEVDAIANSIELLYKDKRKREELIAKGFKNIERFSWEKCAEETLNVYVNLISNK